MLCNTYLYKRRLTSSKKEIIINDFAWVCYRSLFSHGITIGMGAVIGARSVVLSNIKDWEVVAGNPAKFLKKEDN